ncbi:hypothetical protein MK489_17275 [Myxococcota bacterium]|nr:hypothetical protein [Myxococcota bacterium]
MQPRNIRRTSRRRAGLALTCFLLACSGSDSDGSTGHFVARHYALSPTRNWVPETADHKQPQDTPAMVIWEVTQFPPGTQPTTEQRRAATKLIQDSMESARRHGWYDYEKGLADGFESVQRDRLHYVNEEYLFDGRTLDPDRPEYLMYNDSDKTLVGFMYFVSREDERGPQVGGPYTVWHYHVFSRARCALRGLLPVGMPNSEGRCARGEPQFASAEMMHTWFIDRPGGPFSTSMGTVHPNWRELGGEQYLDILPPDENPPGATTPEENLP